MNFTYRCHTSDEFGIKIISSNYLSSSARNVEVVPVDGRDGDLLIDYGNFKNFKLNIEIEIDAQKSELDIVIEEIKSWLYSGVEYSPLVIGGKTFQATFISNLDIAEVYKNVGTCLLIFECKPRSYGVIS
ncbi:MAG: hypothetical protein E6344_18355 [Clostridium sp.]|nr:hypothetical protein [Clostridium sp.]MDU7085661.1 hypothetical protein [Clostridium sp.]